MAGGTRISRRAVSGGPITSYTETGSLESGLFIAKGKIGYRTSGNSLRIVSGTSARTVSLPAGSSGLDSNGSAFVLVVSGTDDKAGVYAVEAQAATSARRVATVPPNVYDQQNLSLSGSQLRYADDSRTDKPGRPVWMRTVSGKNKPRLSDETLMKLPGINGAPAYAGNGISFSGARGAVSASSGPGVRLYDRDVLTGFVDHSGPVQASGAFTLIGDEVYGPDAELLDHLVDPSEPGDTPNADLYGTTAIFTRSNDSLQTQRIMLKRLGPNPATLLDTVTPPAGDGCSEVQVSVWGELAAWSDCLGQSVRIRNLNTNATRTVTTNHVDRLALGEGVLAWGEGRNVKVLDLSNPTSTTVQIPGQVGAFAVDDHRIALDQVNGPLVVQTLPFEPAYRPRLITAYVPPSFRPGATGAAGTWTPQFDVSKPLRNAKLAITDDRGRRVRVLDGTAPDAGIRDLRWDGLDQDGRAAAAGAYTWTLSARSDDGDGQLIGARGESSVTGSVTVVR